MKTGKKNFQEEETQLLSSDQNQAEPNPEGANSNQRPFVRDAAMAAAGVAAGVAGSYAVNSQTTDETGKTDSNDAVSASANEVPPQKSEATNNSTIPSATPLATDDVHEAVKPEISPAPEEVMLTTAHGVHIAHVDNSLTFAEAFADARNQVGAGGVFSHNGQMYNTYYKNEWNAMTSDQKQEYYASVDMEAAMPKDDMLSHPTAEPIHETSFAPVDTSHHPTGDEVYVLGVGSATIEGQEVYVAQLSIGGEDVVLLDIDKDGTFDYAAADANHDGSVSQDEVIDVSQHHITVVSMQEAAQPDPQVFAEDLNMPDYTNDADINHFV